MSFLEGMRAPAQSRRTRPNTSVHAAARKQRGLALLVVVLIAMGLLAGMLAIGFAGDLMRFIQALATQQTGIFIVTRCALDRVARSDSPAPKQANLAAQCDLSWLTVDPGKGKS